MRELDIRQSQAIVAQLDSWYEAIGLEQSTDNIMLKLMEETAESVKSYREYENTPGTETRQHLGGELADVIFCSLAMMNNLGIDANEMMNYVFTKDMGRVNREHISSVQNGGNLQGVELYKKAKEAFDNKE